MGRDAAGEMKAPAGGSAASARSYGSTGATGVGAKLPPSFSQDLCADVASCRSCAMRRRGRRDVDATAAPMTVHAAAANSRNQRLSIFIGDPLGFESTRIPRPRTKVGRMCGRGRCAGALTRNPISALSHRHWSGRSVGWRLSFESERIGYCPGGFGVFFGNASEPRTFPKE